MQKHRNRLLKSASWIIFLALSLVHILWAAEPPKVSGLADQIKQQLQKNPKSALQLSGELAKLTPADSQDIKSLFELIEAAQGDVQQKAIDCLANTSQTNLGATFIPYLKHPHKMVQAAAAGMCGKLKVAESVPALLEIVTQAAPVDGFADTPAERAAVTAVAALGEIRDERAIETLINRTGQLGGYESAALAKFGYKVVPRLLKVMSDEQDKRLRQGASQTLIMINDPQAIPLFRDEIKKPESKARKYAMIALLNSDPENGFKELLSLWQNNRQDAMLEHQLLLHINSQRLKDPNLTPFLIHVLEHNQDRNSRKGAVMALGRIGTDEAVAALKKASNDQDEQVRLYANQALEMLKPGEAEKK